MTRTPLAAYKLRLLRLNKGLSPEALGAEIGISGMTIRRLEEGTLPLPSTAHKIAQHFGLDVEQMWPNLVDQGTTSS